MRLSTLVSTLFALPSVIDALSIAGGGRPSNMIHEAEKREPLQDLVTWDEHSLFIRGERVMIFSGEVHPFRLPVPTLYLDIFQKIKALGFNTVSFYVDWALLEGRRGKVRYVGIFALDSFFKAATEAGIYLLARPGPYINAEVSGGGFPGWLQRIRGTLRTDDPDYINATNLYMAKIASKIAQAQITKGGPVILFQPENEYSRGQGGIRFPNKEYFQYVIDQARVGGIVVPMINNDAFPGGTSAPGTGLGAVDIYGHDAYPVGFDCAHPYTWPADGLPTTLHEQHLNISSQTPYSLIEFQGGSFDPFGGWGFEQCSTLVNHEFERVFYKNNMAAGVTIFNVYMIFGGTNWGNLGHPGGYTSYDYGASIRENRLVDREKYSELKLQAQFMKVSPGYLVTTPGKATQGVYSSNKAIIVTPLLAKEHGHFFVVRHTDYTSTDSTSYTVRLPTSSGEITIPQRGGTLTLHGRDSKFHVTDYPVGNYNLLYSTAEIFTWKNFTDKTALIVYGGACELHELALKNPFKKDEGSPKVMAFEGNDVDIYTMNDSTVVMQWNTSTTRQVIQFDNLTIYMVDRNAAYNYWVPVLPVDGAAAEYGSSIMNPDAVIVNGGYLVRSVSVDGSTLSLKADFNISTPLEIIGAPQGTSRLVVNGNSLKYNTSRLGNWVAKADFKAPAVSLPDLKNLTWFRPDPMPELVRNYDDSLWPVANHTTSKNSVVPLRTPVSLYGSDYGFHTGTLVYRGRFTAEFTSLQLKLWTQGGSAFASSVWLDKRFVGSFNGFDAASDNNSTYELRELVKDRKYVLTIVVDTTGMNENFNLGLDDMKAPRGIMDYALLSPKGDKIPISPWKITGNLGGERYKDTFRGPLNEGGLWFERQGYHYPLPPVDDFSKASPFDGIPKAGIIFYVANLTLNLPSKDYDIPLSFVFYNSTTDTRPYRASLYVNGFQFGKYISNIGPQTEFPVPEGIINHSGENWIGISLWALTEEGARVPQLKLAHSMPVLTGRGEVQRVHGPRSEYRKRMDAY